MPRRWKIFLLVAFATLIADQATKLWARRALPVEAIAGHGLRPGQECAVPDDVASRPPRCRGGDVPVIDGYWEWRLSFNPGSAFGLFQSQTGARVFLSIVGIVAVAAMVWMVKRAGDRQRALLWALGLVAGGAVGNLIDRVYFGVVTDFVLWKYKTHEWPVFNVADVALVVGVGLMFFDVGKDGKPAKGKGKGKGKGDSKADKADSKADKADSKADSKADKPAGKGAGSDDGEPADSGDADDRV